MPPKKDTAKKGAIAGNYKAGKPIKDVMPTGAKPPREGTVVKLDGEPNVQRHFEYEPLTPFPEWPGNDEAKNHDFTSGCEKDEDGTVHPFEDKTEIFLPPSFKDHMRDTNIWLRPDEYITEVLAFEEHQKRKAEKRRMLRARKSIRKATMMNMGGQDGELTEQQKEILNSDISTSVNKAEIMESFKKTCIAVLERLETEEECKKRKEEMEAKAALEKGAKKKPPPKKGEAQPDPMDEP